MFHQFTVIKVSAANHCHDAFSWHRACQCLNPCDGQGRLCHNLSICKLCPNQLRQQEQSDTDKKNAMCVETEKSSDNMSVRNTRVYQLKSLKSLTCWHHHKGIDAKPINNQATALAENSQTLKVILSCESRWNASDAVKQLRKLPLNLYDPF